MELSKARIFFGHQSVGYNLVDGIRDLAARDPRIRLRVLESRNAADAERGGFLHGAIGRNTHPNEKDADFLAVLDRGFGQSGDIAFYKYCYVDIQPGTDVRALFGAYKHSYETARARYPELTIVHVTMPLMVSEGMLAARWKAYRLGYSQRELNAARNEFNRLLLAEYGKTGLLFDLARMESSRPDGSREGHQVGGDTVFSLVPEYTFDGGHLNEPARRFIAERLVAFLARVNASRVTARPALTVASTAVRSNVVSRP
ncbi:MAG TPA: hypothetical protein VJU87_05290 [Gemmatimonadaceae bacterium]|nr:hypothetical protein [Gemmatimonadaceae bacterium]